MSASVQFRPNKRDLGTVMREVDKNLAIFLGLCNGENERNDSHHPVEELSEFDDSTVHSFGYETSANTMSDIFSVSASQPKLIQIQADYDFLNVDVDKIDYDWNVTLPDPPLPLEVVVQESLATRLDIPKCEDNSPVHQLLESNIEEYALVDNNLLQPATPTSVDSPASARRKPVPSETRKPTPTTRPTLPSKVKPSYKPTSTTAQTRSSTSSKSTPRSSTPMGPHLEPIISKSGPRSCTPICKPIPSCVSAGGQPSSGRKKDPSVLKNPLVLSKPVKYSNGLSQSHVTENAKSLVPKRPTSASRPRPTVVASHLSSPKSKQVENMNSPPSLNSKNVVANKTGSVVMMSRIQGSNNGSDVVNPVLIGSKMVERMVNMRKLAPPTQDGKLSHDNNAGKSFREKSGFGRSLSRKSLDMALRHMDISRSIPEKI